MKNVNNSNMVTSEDQERELFAEAFNATKDDRMVVPVLLASRSTRVDAMAGRLSPAAQAAITAGKNLSALLLFALHRDGLNQFFAEANDTPFEINIESAIGTLEKFWPILLVVNDDGIGVHLKWDGEVPELERPAVVIGWPERVVNEDSRS